MKQGTTRVASYPVSFLIRRWKQRFEEDGKRAIPGHGNPRDEELAKLRKELRRVKEENIVLKKAAGWRWSIA